MLVPTEVSIVQPRQLYAFTIPPRVVSEDFIKSLFSKEVAASCIPRSRPVGVPVLLCSHQCWVLVFLCLSSVIRVYLVALIFISLLTR